MRYIITIFTIIITDALLAKETAGYYNTLNGKQTSALKTELHNILMQDTNRYYSYGSGANHTWNGFYITDRDSTNNLVIDMYSYSVQNIASNNITQNNPGYGQVI